MRFTEKYRLQEKMLDRYRCLLDSGELNLEKDKTHKRLVLIEIRKISAWLKEWRNFYVVADRHEQNDEMTVGDAALLWREENLLNSIESRWTTQAI